MDRYFVRAALFLSFFFATTLHQPSTGAAMSGERLRPPRTDLPLAAGAPAVSDPIAECPRRMELPYHIRTVDCVMATAIVEGSSRSETLRQLVDRVGALKGIVYVESGYTINHETRRVLTGALQHRMIRAGEDRLLWIKVAPEPGDRAAVLIAHELQHAIELLESSATTEAEIDEFFRQIGTEAGAWIVETTAAIEIERIVTRELAVTAR